MDTTLYLIKLGEIALKGQNRAFFEKKLKENIKEKLRPYNNRLLRQKGRLFLEVEQATPSSIVHHALTTTAGIVGYARSIKCHKALDSIIEAAISLTGEQHFLEGTETFKVETRRADKSFPLDSYTISSALGTAILNSHPQLKVSVRNPHKTLYVEIRDQAYLYYSPQGGLSGLPVGTAGRGMLMLSGGIDSPVSGYLMAKRGLKLESIYYHSYPYTSDEAKEKVIRLGEILSPYLNSLVLHIVPFTPIQLHIAANGPVREHTLLMRACMMKIANLLATKRDCQAIVTGESLSQVASQTVESLAFTNSMSNLPVFRPLIGLDKAFIIELAKEIGTYETSILPFDDCCTLFSPKHPVVRPDLATLQKSYAKMEIEGLYAEAVEKCETLHL
ncbi:MAG: tRNA uracil 4-sulfurtransferase ThiI [Sphaerochaetaceae bacterium]